MSKQHLEFCLGGYDLEMVTIADFLKLRNAVVHDKHLAWGAKLSQYRNEISLALKRSSTVVAIELNDDLDLSEPYRRQIISIDHHRERAGVNQPTSIEQVTSLFGITATDFADNRHWTLVAANDRGHIRAMRRLNPPASDAEVRLIRTRDFASQGISEAMLIEAKAWNASAEARLDGRLTVLRVLSDRLGLHAEMLETLFGGPGYQNLLVFGDTQVGFYGEGRVVSRLAEASPQKSSWYGGELPDHGFWGGVIRSLGFEPSFVVEAALSTG